MLAANIFLSDFLFAVFSFNLEIKYQRIDLFENYKG
jgi:hypothetical protein